MKFLRSVLATIVGIALFMFLSSIVFFLMLTIASSGESEVKIPENSVLHVKLSGAFKDRDKENPFEGIPGMEMNQTGVYELRQAIKQAAIDENIKGIYIENPSYTGGYALAKEIRDELEAFRNSGKFIVAYGQTYTEGGYYISSVADEIYINPDYGFLELDGLASTKIFFKKTLEKLQIEPYIFRVGEYKSAVEPFIREDMSKESKEQTRSFIGSIYRNMVSEMAESRGISAEELRNMSDNMLIKTSTDAIKYGLVDSLYYHDQAIARVKAKMGLEPTKKIALVSYNKLYKTIKSENKSKNKIAVLVAEGEIMGGKGDETNIGAAKFTEELKKLRESKNVKAVVLRINSPGGSASASDEIWREIKLLSDAKPVITSMSNVCASGGYYMAMATDTIMAQPNTITGSIGVFGMFFNIQKFMDNKLGITSDGVNTGLYSDLGNSMRPMSDQEQAFVQGMVEKTYDVFKTKASEGRGMSKEELEKVASGRVWSGEEALDKGLIDLYGGLDDAVVLAAKMAKLEENDYKVRMYPAQKPFIERLIEELGQNMKMRIVTEELGEIADETRQVLKIKEIDGIQTRMPIGESFGF